MKNLVIGLLIIAVFCVGAGTQPSNKDSMRWASNTFLSCADETKSYDFGNGDGGLIEQIIIDSAGTDTSYTVYIIETLDDVDYVHKTYTCSSAAEPYIYIVNSTDESSNTWAGLPMCDNIKVRVYDGAGLTSCKVILKGKFDSRR